MSEFTLDKTIMDKLAAPFAPEDIEWRVQQAGVSANGKMYALVIPYIDNRAIQNRLDQVVGFENWKNEFTSTPNSKGTLAGISIRNGDEWITKWDGAEDTDIESTKGGLSTAMKRAGVQWGIGRYLYKLEGTFVNPQDTQPQDMTGWNMAQVKLDKASPKKTRIYYKIPKLPDFALPKER